VRGNRDTTLFGISPNGAYQFGGGTAYATVPIRSASGGHDISIGDPLPDALTGLLDASAFSYAEAVAPPMFAQGASIGDSAVHRDAYNFYLQDTWKVTRKLTLDYGIRWDYQTAPEELYNRASMFGPTVVNENAGNLLGGTIFEGNGAGKCNCQFTTTYPFAIGPRLGIAYQFAPKMVLRAGWGLSYGPTPDGAGTGAVGEGWNTLSFSSTSFGETPYIFGQGLPYTAAQIFSTDYDPGIRPQTGQINNPPTYEDRNAGRPSRINQWNIAVQRELTPNIAAEVAYVGNHGVWLQSSSYWDLNALTPQRISQAGLNLNSTADLSLLNSPLNSSLAASRGFNVPPYPGFPLTLTVAQALRPYPQFGSIVEDWAPLGDTWYDALQAKITKRTSYGLAITAAYTRSKTLDVEAENYNGGGVINDEYNRNNLKALSASDLPQVFVVSYNYIIPKFTPYKAFRAVVGGWSLSGTLQYQNGALVATPAAQNNLSTALFRSTLFNRVPGVPLYTENPNSHIDPNAQFLYNPAAWSDPGPGQWGFGAPYYSDFRARRLPGENMSLGRIFHIWEKMNLEIRGEFFNAFNRIVVPGASPSNPLQTQVVSAAGVPQSGFGFMNASSGTQGRTGQVVARFVF